MPRATRISGGQLVTLFLASRLSQCLLLTPADVADVTLSDSLFSTLLSSVFLFLLFVPTLLVLRRCRHRGLVDIAYLHSRGMGRTVCLAYLLLCLFILGWDVVQFYDFAAKSMKADFSVTALTVAIAAVACVAACYGVEALSRAALPVMVFSALSLLVFSAALLPEMRLLHFSPSAGGGFAVIVKRAVMELPRTAEVVAIGMLYPHIGGSRGGAAVGFSALTAVFTALVSTTTLGVLGDFAAHIAYPYYASVTAVQFGVFQGMDIVITTVWLSTFFVRLALFFSLFLNASRRLFGRRFRVPLAALAVFLLAVWTVCIDRGMLTVTRQPVTGVYWVVLGAFCVVLPPLLWLLSRGKRGRAV